MWRSRFNNMDRHFLLSHELSSWHLEIRPSTIPNAGKGIFTQKDIGVNEVINYFYGILVYDNAPTSTSASNNNKIGDEIVHEPLNKFCAWVVNLQARMPMGKGPNSNETDVWIYPVSLLHNALRK